MKFKLIFCSSVSACFELDNDTAFYNTKSYRVCVNGLWGDVEKKENVFSLFSLAPDTEYTVSTSLSDHSITFRTEKETCAYTVKSFGAVGDGKTNDTINVQNAIDMCPNGGRVVFEKGVVENAGGKFLLYTDDGVSEIKIDKKELVGEAYKGGNVSDLGGYYNELVYFTSKAKKGEKIEKATLFDGVSSLEFLLKEIAFDA